MVPSEAIHQAESLSERPTEYSLVEQKNLRLAEIHKELQAGRKIQAIAMFRETFGTSLSDAKEAVEALERGGTVDLSRSALKQNYEATQGQTQQEIYPGTRPGQPPNQVRIAIAILGALLALGIAAFVMMSGK